jgi:hypothetical protein
VALGMKLAVIMHRMLITKEVFKITQEEKVAVIKKLKNQTSNAKGLRRGFV